MLALVWKLWGGHRMCRQVSAEAGGDEDPVWPKGWSSS